ncbi:hypothetical protein [Rhodococcus triatomae]
MSAAAAFGVTAAAAAAVSTGAGTATAATTIGCSQAFNIVTCSFVGTTTEQYLRVPRGVKVMKVTAVGGPGAGVVHPGGRGGFVETNIDVVPGSMLYIRVNADGVGNGGGASSVATKSIDNRAAGLASRLVVAPGGGGAAEGGSGGDSGLLAPEYASRFAKPLDSIDSLEDLGPGLAARIKAAGDFESGDEGLNLPGAGGRGATVTGGGAGGKIEQVLDDGSIRLVSEGAPGTLGVGGEGDGNGGAGGAGYYGGGGGADGAGGGGGSYLVPTGGTARPAEMERRPSVVVEFTMGLDGMLGSFGSSGHGTMSSAWDSAFETTTSSVFAS